MPESKKEYLLAVNNLTPHNMVVGGKVFAPGGKGKVWVTEKEAKGLEAGIRNGFLCRIRGLMGRHILLKDARQMPQKPVVYRNAEGHVIMTETPIPIPVEHPRVQVQDDEVCHDCLGCISKGTIAIQTPLGLIHTYCVEESGKAHRDELKKRGY